MTVFDNTGSFAKLLDEIDDADLYGRPSQCPKVKAYADAMWEAMDQFGRLPEGWTYKGEAK